MHRPTVLLRHDLPDHSHHYDWMLDLGRAPDAPLTTFRLREPVHELKPGGHLPAERLADHRRLYLDYEGPISNNRGNVRRLAAGRFHGDAVHPDRWHLTILWDAWPSSPQCLELHAPHAALQAPQSWSILCVSQFGVDRSQ